ncbi:tetratricopeptide repeat protein [Saccharothrix carnea]|uniref:Tetratricopeptide repeat protein n=1 Tax=Saccharothrix carnea TaxID=1280637 RepID=A0A2P8I5L0_SACCR|nr:tetratricopeptide repeat protein [Saccharothrix carnea]PSL53754.1 tetratricopeptide repeat protein [Saccharothrix carnea]
MNDWAEALATSPPSDRARVLLNLAHLSDDRQHAVDLLTEAIAVGEGRTRVIAIASRADLLPWLDRWEEAWQDVDLALADADPPGQVVLRNTRVGLLMMAGRLAEAEADALDLVDLAASHAPEYLENIYTNLALLADEAGDQQQASTYRMLSDNPGRHPLGPRWLRFVELNTQGAALLASGNRTAAKATFTAAYHEVITTSDPSGTIKTGVPLAGTSAQQPPAPTAVRQVELAAQQPPAPTAVLQAEVASHQPPVETAVQPTETSGQRTPAETAAPPAGTAAQWSPAENPAPQPAEPPASRSPAGNPTPQPSGTSAQQHPPGDSTEPTTDIEALVCRAGVAGNLAGVADHPEEAVRWSTEAVEAARGALALVGDAYGSATVLVNALISRAAARHAQTRHPEALTDLDGALEVVAASAEGGESLEATIRATRARVLATGGWFAEAAEEGRVALDLAYTAAPELAASVHLTLAEVTSATGDLPGAAEHLGLARDLSAATGDVDGETTALLSSARLAYLASDVDRADALYDEAEALITDDPNRLLACLNGRAAVEVLRGRPHEALRCSDRALALLTTTTSPLATLAVHQVRGSAFESAGRFAEAEACYAEASARCEEAGLWHVALGMAWWRADALVRRAAATTGNERRQLGRKALDLALPAALASEAVRQRFPHGPLRERWVALASAPATRSAFLAIRAVEDTALAAQYIDHIAGAVSLRAESTAPVERGELIGLPAPPPTTTHLPYAAAGFATGTDLSFPAAGFELPPRVRPDPAVRTALDDWIDVAEQRYGLPVRSERAVPSW